MCQESSQKCTQHTYTTICFLTAPFYEIHVWSHFTREKEREKKRNQKEGEDKVLKVLKKRSESKCLYKKAKMPTSNFSPMSLLPTIVNSPLFHIVSTVKNRKDADRSYHLDIKTTIDVVLMENFIAKHDHSSITTDHSLGSRLRDTILAHIERIFFFLFSRFQSIVHSLSLSLPFFLSSFRVSLGPRAREVAALKIR